MFDRHVPLIIKHLKHIN